jgi:hypothetical protein
MVARCLIRRLFFILPIVLLVPVPATVAQESVATVSGLVVFEGEAPPPTVVQLNKAMQQAAGQKTETVQPWLVGKNQGLANCVATLEAKDPAKRVAAKPLENAELEKVGARFVPRVVVVTKGTKLTYRNKNSACRCFNVSGDPLRAPNLNEQVPAGSKREVLFAKPCVCRVTADLQPYMLAWIHVVDTPWYAVTDAEGRFQIKGVPPGAYQVRVWHEELGRLPKGMGPQEITVTSDTTPVLKYTVSLKKEKGAAKVNGK